MKLECKYFHNLFLCSKICFQLTLAHIAVLLEHQLVGTSWFQSFKMPCNSSQKNEQTVIFFVEKSVRLRTIWRSALWGLVVLRSFDLTSASIQAKFVTCSLSLFRCVYSIFWILQCTHQDSDSDKLWKQC